MKPSLGLIVFVLISWMFSAPVLAEDPRINGTSAEGPFFDFYLGKDLTGYVRTKEGTCDTCKEVTIRISSDVEAKLDGEIVPLSRFVLSGHQPSILHFDRKGKLAQIVWYSK